MDEPFDVFEESPSMRRAPVSRRVDDMFEQIKLRLPGAPKFLLCLLPERKNCEVYGWFMFIFGCLTLPMCNVLLSFGSCLILFQPRSLEEEVSG
jgi:hypothetical protein